MSITSIIGLEDPLYPLNTDALVIKYIYNNCSISINLTKVIGEGEYGKGNGTGNVVLYSTIGGTPNDLESFCDNSPADELDDLILVMDRSFGVIFNEKVDECLNISSPKHFGGVITYGLRVNLSEKDITIPWISRTGDLNLSDGDCVLIRNIGTIHQVIMGISSGGINTSCYMVSNLEGYGENCSEKYPEGGSFFDRLDGNYFVSGKYTNQSYEYFNETKIGIEAIIDIYELLYHSIPINENATWIDYLYWQGVNGSDVFGLCSSWGYRFKLDCPHAEKYGY
jgi:hypothetical protein